MDKSAAEFEGNLKEMNNSLSAFTSNVTGMFGTAQLSKTDTLYKNTSWNLISNDRNLLSQLYVTHGIVQTLVDQPVDDAFRTGFEIKTGQLSADEIEDLQIFIEEYSVITNLMQGLKWARLYGGGGVLIVTTDDPETPLNIETLKKGDPVAFKEFDMWEMYADQVNEQGQSKISGTVDRLDSFGEFYNYYGHKVHKSRVLRINGKSAPAFVRQRMRGWGMSEVERCIRDLNQYMKNQDVVFELLDEAKIDVFKMSGFNTALMTATGTDGISKRVQHANMVKNFQNAITMDIKDEYDQKQISFAGLSDMLVQIKQGVAAAIKMPLTKLFGISAAGFSSGEDDIENYNSMVEGEVRTKSKFPIIKLLQICCQVRFGHIPDDLMVKFHPLRVLSAKEEEEVKDRQFNRVIAAQAVGLATDQEAKAAFNKASLLPVEVDESSDAVDMEQDFDADGDNA
jgi:uncharacterized protein